MSLKIYHSLCPLAIVWRLWCEYLFYILKSGTEQEWKIAESNMEAAANTLLAATNELCIASVKANTASGVQSYLSPSKIEAELVHPVPNF